MAPPSGAAPKPDPSPTISSPVQFMLRNIDSRTIVVRAQREDTLDSVLERLGNAVARRGDRQVEYAGRCLPGEATIGELGLPPDATLHVTSRLLSTPHPDAWNVAAEVVAAAAKLAAPRTPPAYAAYLDGLVGEFLNLACAACEKKTYNPLGPVADHMAIFLRSGAPGVLAQLYLSPDDACRAAAESAIRRFLMPDLLTEHGKIKAWTAPVLLEFSRYIASARRQASDPLYADLRSTLPTVICNAAWSPACWFDLPFERLAEQLTRFVVEKAGAVTEHLAGACLMQAADRRNLGEFRVFSSVLRQKVRWFTANAPRRAWWTALHEALVSLLRHVDGYMAMIDSCLRQQAHCSLCSAPAISWTAPLLCVWVVLAEVDAWSDIDGWPDIRCALRATLSAHALATRALALRAGTERCENAGWIARHRDLLDFEARRHLAMSALPRLAAEGSSGGHEMVIDRAQLLTDSFWNVAHEAPEKLRADLSVEFVHEHATGPGVRREWFCMVFQTLFSPRHVLFSACPSDRRKFFVNPASAVDPMHWQYYEFTGRMVALALMHKIPVGVSFDRTLFLHLAVRRVTLYDIVDADPSLHASCKMILEMDPSLLDSNVLGLTFVREVELFGSRTVTELISGGKDIAVNSKNRGEYIRLLIEDTFVNCTRNQVAYLTLGFSGMFRKCELAKNFLQALDVEDFNQMLGGSKDTIDVREWEAHTDYHGYSSRSRKVKWFWKAVRAMTAEQQRHLLFFWTSVEYLPFDGFSGLGSRLSIFKSHNSCDHLPTSGTCFYQLNLPDYTSLEMMQSRLEMIAQEHVSSSFGTF